MIASELQTPRRGSKQSAQGITLGTGEQRGVALKGQKHSTRPYWGKRGKELLLPFQGEGLRNSIKPKAMPWADSLMSFQDSLEPRRAFNARSRTKKNSRNFKD